MKHTIAKLWRWLNIPKDIQLMIMRLTNDEFLVGVTGVIVNEKNEILILKHSYRQTPWSLPGGYLKRGEHPMQGVEREILEETGMTVKVEKIIRTIHDSSTARLDISCFGKFISGEFVASAEVTDHGFFTFEKLPHIGTKQKKLIAHTLKTETPYKIAKPTLFNRISGWFKK